MHEHPVAAVFVAALVVRLAVAIGSFVVNEGVLIPDEHQYIALAESVAEGRGADAWAPGYGSKLFETTWAFSGPLAGLFWAFSASRLVGQLFVVLLGAGAAALTARLALEGVSCRWAIAAGAVVALFPSQVLWSSVVLREAAVWLALIVVSLAVAIGARIQGRSLVFPGIVAAVALLALGFLRDHTLVPAAWAFALAAVTTGSNYRAARVAGAVAIAAAIPLVAGAGVFGLGLVSEAAPVLAERRAGLAEGAESAFVDPNQVDSDGESTTGDLRDRPGDRDGPVEGWADNIRYFPRGFVAVVLRPFPWESSTSLAMAVARIENVVWYALYAVAAAGALLGRRLWSVVGYPFLVAGFIIGIGALSQGNLGTAFRHRGQILWALALLSVIALAEVTSRRTSPAPEAVGSR